MKTIIFSIIALFYSPFSEAQKPLAPAFYAHFVSQSPGNSYQHPANTTPSEPTDTNQAARLTNKEFILTFLASDIFAVLGVVLAAMAGLLWSLFFSNMFKLTSNEEIPAVGND